MDTIRDTLDNPRDTHGRLIAASRVNGTAVYNHNGEKLGSIYDVMLEKVSGRAEYAVLSFGGFLGIGDSYHPLPWNQLTYDTNRGGYVVDIDRDRLQGAPAYSAQQLSSWDDGRLRELDTYYGTGAGAGAFAHAPGYTAGGSSASPASAGAAGPGVLTEPTTHRY